jgi:hypothetical protein
MNEKRIAKEKLKPKKRPETVWCSFNFYDNQEAKPLQVGGKRPNHVRCPKCGRRLTPQTVTHTGCGEPFEPSYLIPKHKIPYSKR